MLTDRIAEDIKVAMKAREEARLSTLRMLSTALKNKKIDLMHELSDEESLGVVRTMTKQYRDALADFTRGGRTDLMEKTTIELAILETYLPAGPSNDDIRAAVAAAIGGTGATGAKDFGKVMGIAMKQLGGIASGDAVSAIVRELLP